uniref:Protein TsetseEP domain-containing protein n=1 Tax=Anopheles minimus TaxID=112268 RepID=A0A182WJM7_9DIPT
MERVALLILLLQTSLAIASPDYGLPNSVIGTAKVLSSVNEATTYLDTLAAAKLVSASIARTEFGLPNIVQILKQTGNTASQDGINVANALSSLAQSSSGDATILFDAVLKSIQDALKRITEMLPTTKSSLSALIGSNVPDRLTDCFGRIESSLKTLEVEIGTLKSAILAAVAEAGSPTSISANILGKHITAKKVYSVVRTVRNLRAFLPVVRYTLNTAIEDAVEADSFLTAYTTTVAALDGMVTIVLQSLNVAEQGFYATLKSGIQALASSYANMKESTLLLPINEDSSLGAEIGSMLSKFSTTLGDPEKDILSVATELQSYLGAIKSMVAITDPQVVSITDSKLIEALIQTLIYGGPYSRYCFNKYKALVSYLISYLLDESIVCVEREIPRLANLATTVQSVLDVNAFDFEDIYDWLTICNELQVSTDRTECVARIAQSYTPLGDYFADKYDLLFDLTTSEVNASKQRANICINLSRRSIADGFMADLQDDIKQCANVYEMNRLVLAFGIVCLLQGLFAEPRPGFGLTNNLSATSKITEEKNDAKSESDAISALTVAALTSGMTKLTTVKTKVETVITQFSQKVQAVATGYDTLVGATDGNIDNAFGPFITAIDAAVTYITGDGATIATDLAGISYTGIADQLTDAFTRIVGGLGDVKTKTLAVKTGVLAAFNSAQSPSVNSDVLRQHVTLKTMYNLLSSVTKLRTYLPLVKYILKTTIENIAEADTYVAALKSSLTNDVTTITGSFTNSLQTRTTALANDIGTAFSSQAVGFGVVRTTVNAMTGISGATAYSDLQSALSSLTSALSVARRVSATSTMQSAFDDISSGLTTLINTLSSSVSVVDNPLTVLLIDTLMGNDEYGRYCYQKYKEPVEALFDMSFDGGWMCIDKEIVRLMHLQTALFLIIDQIAIDLEDIESQIGVCNTLGLASNSNVNACVSALAGYYSPLFAATRQKIDLVYEIATNEAVASKQRLLICFQLVNLDVSVIQVAAITEGLTICSQNGPNGTD